MNDQHQILMDALAGAEPPTASTPTPKTPDMQARATAGNNKTWLLRLINALGIRGTADSVGGEDEARRLMEE